MPRDRRCVLRGERSGSGYRRRTDRRLRRGERAGAESHRQRQACGHRQQGAAGDARQRDLQGRAGQGRDGRVRGGGGGRHPHHQGAARRPDREPHRVDRRHHQRHHQLHPVRDARQGPELRHRAERGAASGLRRSRPDLRHRRRGCGAQDHHPVRAGVRHPDAVRQGLYRRHLQAGCGRHQVRRTTRLPHQAAGHHQAHSGRRRAARASRR